MLDQDKRSKEIENLSFEDALEKLEKIVEVMENGEVTLDNSIANYEYGIMLKKHLEKKLEQAKLKISKITED